MKRSLCFILILIAFSKATVAQDTIPRPTPFDEGYLFIGSDDLLKFKGYGQTDFYTPIGESPAISEFSVRRARLAATGYFQGKFRYMLYARFDKGKAELNEAFIESRHLPYAKIRVGQFFAPFSLSNLTSSSQLDLMTRPLIIDNFSSGRDVGAMLFGSIWRGHIDYAAGVFNGVPRNTPENNKSKDVVARIILKPFKTWESSVLSNISFGVSSSSGIHQEDFSNKEYKNVLGTPLLKFGDSIQQNGSVKRLGGDIEWFVGCASIKAEYLTAKFEGFTKNSSFNVFDASGFYTTITYFLTGEENNGKTVKPTNEFNPSLGHWGAFEIAGRYENLSISPSALGLGAIEGTNDTSALSFGINWYPNDDVKIVANYQAFHYSDNLSIENKTFNREKAFLMRFQYQF
ncbi:OprO/OprP family phosphate-selective porin [Flagellimonas zhangzhouensis]|uniref:Phosphate-selective porin n=1 Tax=Flagellimonas zhangzhouensis TaxID=1073328 RepID=A0A1H2YDT3_9FLAO|nr:porin [Allomuricauda zhangzhouensis]SDQ96624.1 Phosphate-selective porin [Allomuricauda zhangzhouensis]SDX03363.1 Phosphate-selective porin [Allomuricauda zhangzhouensis]